MGGEPGTDGPVDEGPIADRTLEREAVRRDAAAYRRDRTADERDHSADLRDDAAAERDATAERSEPAVGSAVTAATRDQSAAGRRLAASDRSRARGDREAGARGRMDSERDRISAQLDRGTSASGGDATDVDALTGAYRRAPGLAALDHDVSRARRRGESFVVARITVGELAAADDGRGEAAGDRLLVLTASALRAASTGDQVLLRLDGSRFVHGLPGLTLDEARRRVGSAAAVIAAAADGAAVATGFAALGAGDSTGDLLARAGAAPDGAATDRRATDRTATDRLATGRSTAAPTTPADRCTATDPTPGGRAP